MSIKAKKAINGKGQKKRHGLGWSLRHQKAYWCMLIPSAIFFLLFCYLPMSGVYMAFTRYDYSLGIFKSPFIGWKNFEYLFGAGMTGGFFSSKIWQLTKNTLLYNLVFILLGNFLQILMAVMLKELPGRKFRKVSQTVMFLPYFISFTIVGVIAYNLFGSYGTINSLLKDLGMESVSFYQNKSYWPWIIVFFNIWKGLGYGTVVYFAALAGVDESLYEAAYVDGATTMKRIRYITLPMLKPTVVTLVLFSMGGILRGQFDLFYNLVGANSALFETTDIIDTFVYRCVAVSPNLGLGSAAGFYQSVFGLVFVCIVNGIVRKIEPDNALF